jgi:hypothetical protein
MCFIYGASDTLLGSNDLNQLGDGTTNPSLVPINVAGGLAFKNVSAGLGAACGIDSNDKLYCWGNNNSGQVGDGTTVNKSVPTAIDSANTYSFVSTDGGGTGSTCGILVSGILKCWGIQYRWAIGGWNYNSKNDSDYNWCGHV